MKKQQIVARVAEILKKFQAQPELVQLFQQVKPTRTRAQIVAELRKALDEVKNNPETIAALNKAYMAKDDKPHAKDSPKDKAHDIVEERQPVKQAIQQAQGDQGEVLDHLRTLRNRRGLRSHLNRLVGKSELAKARMDEGKGLESKIRARQQRNVRDVKVTKTPSGQKTRTAATQGRREHALEVKGASRRHGEKIVGTPREINETHGVHIRQATYAPKARGSMQTGAMSEPGGNKSYRSGGKYHVPGGEKAAHHDVMSGIKGLTNQYTKNKLTKAELTEMLKSDEALLNKGLGDTLRGMKNTAKRVASSSAGRKVLATAAALDMALVGGAAKLGHDMIKKPEAKPPVQAQNIAPLKAKPRLDKAELAVIKEELSAEYKPKFKKCGDK